LPDASTAMLDVPEASGEARNHLNLHYFPGNKQENTKNHPLTTKNTKKTQKYIKN